jgi:hypothetical protein
LLVAALIGICAPADAQEVATTIDQLRVLVRPGDEVTVTDASGNAMKGRISTLSPSSLELIVGGSERTLGESDLRRIRQKRQDPLSNGARNGFLVGGVFGALVGFAAIREVGTLGVGVMPLAIGLYGGLGAAAGVGIDAMITSDQVIFDSAWKRKTTMRTNAVGVTLARW